MTSNYTVLAVTLLTWAGLFIYLLKLDHGIKRLEKK